MGDEVNDMDEDLERILERIRLHNAAIARLLDDERGRAELIGFVNHELALLGFLLEETGEAPPEEGEAPGKTPDEEKGRLRDKAKEWIRRNGKDIAKELLLKLNNLLAGAITGGRP
jgi:hypothetical protein